MPKKTIALATAVVAVALLAGCSTGGSGSGATTAAKETKPQTQAQACKSLEGDLQEVSQGLQSQMSTFQSDPKTAVTELKKFDAKLKSAADKVTNEKVHTTVTEFESSFSGLLTQLEAYSNDPKSVDATKLQTAVSDVQSSTTEMSKVCSTS